MALHAATQEAMWLKHLFKELGFPQNAVTIKGDNRGSIRLAENPILHGRCKHIDIKHHFIREKVKSKDILLEWISTSEMAADIMTKPLGPQKFLQVRKK